MQAFYHADEVLMGNSTTLKANIPHFASLSFFKKPYLTTLL
jgi:hypothetical protein